MSRGHVSRTKIVVVATRHAVHGEHVPLKRQSEIHVAGKPVQASDIGITELSTLHVIHGRAIDIDVVVLLVEATIPEAYWGEQVSHLRGVYVVGGVEDGDISRHVIVLSQLRFSESESILIQSASHRLSRVIHLGRGHGIHENRHHR